MLSYITLVKLHMYFILKLRGPFYAAKLYDQDFLQRCLQACGAEKMPELPGVTSWKKITGLLTAMLEEQDVAGLPTKAANQSHQRGFASGFSYVFQLVFMLF